MVPSGSIFNVPVRGLLPGVLGSLEGLPAKGSC